MAAAISAVALEVPASAVLLPAVLACPVMMSVMVAELAEATTALTGYRPDR